MVPYLDILFIELTRLRLWKSSVCPITLRQVSEHGKKTLTRSFSPEHVHFLCFATLNNYLRFSAGETHDLILERVTGDRMSCPCLHHITQYSILAVWSAILLIVLLNKSSSRTEEASDKKLREGSSQEPIRSLGPS